MVPHFIPRITRQSEAINISCLSRVQVAASLGLKGFRFRQGPFRSLESLCELAADSSMCKCV